MLMKRVLWVMSLTGTLLYSAGAVAGPKMAVDKFTIDFGTVHEKDTPFLTHTFNLKNIGDSALQIYNIRAGCGCTTFTNDSVIAPGKTGYITMRLDLAALRPGKFYAYLKVTTNNPDLYKAEFGFSGVLKSVIYTDPAAIVLPTMEKKDTICAVTMFSEKPDLSVTRIFFAMDNPPSEWLAKIPIKFDFKKTGKKNNEGYWSYELRVFYPSAQKETQYGKFIVATNHPNKPEVKISGEIDPK